MKRTILGLLTAVAALILAPGVAAAQSDPGHPSPRPAAGSTVTSLSITAAIPAVKMPG